MVRMTDEEVEVVARALCKGQGSDPDTPSYWGVPFMIGNRGHGAMGHPVPAWHLFALDARAAITALDAFRKEKVG